MITLTKGSVIQCTWDEVNRMTQLYDGQADHNYRYRADGMRKVKTKFEYEGLLDPPVDFYHYPSTVYFYDGQMCIEACGVEGDKMAPYGNDWQFTAEDLR
jgi:hypothetical protein